MERVLNYDAATAIDTGKRDYQEDAVLCDFIQGAATGFAVIADGMGGHAAGDVASRIAADTALAALQNMRRNMQRTSDIRPALQEIAETANQRIRDHSASQPETCGMGTTLLATVVRDGALHWISVGDSPLFLFRKGSLRQLNQDHSLAPQIDLLVASGHMSAEEGKFHPDRNVLTSVLVGRSIAQIDAPQEPVALQSGDVLIVSSDGLQSLDLSEIEVILRRLRSKSSAEIVTALLKAVQRVDDPEQDNLSFSVIRVLSDTAVQPVLAPLRLPVASILPKLRTAVQTRFGFVR